MKTSILMIGNHEKKERFLLFLFGFASTIDALWFIPFISFPDILFLFFIGSPISWAMLNPSVSPFKISANGLVVESSNPAVRLYRYNTYSGEVSY